MSKIKYDELLEQFNNLSEDYRKLTNLASKMEEIHDNSSKKLLLLCDEAQNKIDKIKNNNSK